MQFARSRTLRVKQHSLPLSLISINKVRARESLLHLTHIVDVHAGLKCELLRDDVCLRTTAILEAEIVGAAEGQLALQLTALVGIVSAADLCDEAFDLGTPGGVEVSLDRLVKNLCLRGANLLVHC